MTKVSKPLFMVFGIYILCFLFRAVEYFVIKTDRSFWGEAFLHKLLGIIVLVFAVRLLSSSLEYIGFEKKNSLKFLFYGLAFGMAVFTIAYVAEIMILFSKGEFSGLSLYVSTYAIDENVGNNKTLLFFAICIAGNIINVIMEEGLFRGLFQRILEQRYKFIMSATISALFFGFWHIISPIRAFVEGSSLEMMLANLIMLVVTSFLAGFQFALITKLTGSLYAAMGSHFVNNAIVNMLHVVSTNGADELMVVRLTIAQSISFILVLAAYIINIKSKKRLSIK